MFERLDRIRPIALLKTKVRVSQILTVLDDLERPVVHRLFIKTSDHLSPSHAQRLQYGAAWRLYKGEGELTYPAKEGMGRLDGDHTKGFFPALIDCVSSLAGPSSLVLVCDQKYVIDHLCKWAALKADKFLRPNGKPYADTDAMVTLDQLLTEKGITIDARRPEGEETIELKSLILKARRTAENDNNRPPIWQG